MGGLISFYTGLHYPKIFSKLAILSPSFWFNRQIFDWVTKQPKKFEMQLCMVGNRTESYTMERDITNMYWTLRNAGCSEQELIFEIRNRGKHNEKFWGREFSFIYKELFIKRG